MAKSKKNKQMVNQLWKMGEKNLTRPLWKSRFFGIGLEVPQIPDVLQQGEKPLAFAPCRYRGRWCAVVVTDARVIVMSRGWFGQLSNNVTQSIYYENTNGATISGGLIGSVEIQTSGEQNDMLLSSMWYTDKDYIADTFNTAKHQYDKSRQNPGSQMDTKEKINYIIRRYNLGEITYDEAKGLLTAVKNSLS